MAIYLSVLLKTVNLTHISFEEYNVYANNSVDEDGEYHEIYSYTYCH